MLDYRDIEAIEQDIMNGIARAAIARGYVISVHDGDDYVLNRSQSVPAILFHAGATDVTTFLIRNQHGENLGSILFIHGNGVEVVADCTDVPAITVIVDYVTDRVGAQIVGSVA